MWECPDVYPVSLGGKGSIDTSKSIEGSNLKFVLKVSLFDIRRDYYMIGNYSFDQDVFKPDNGSIRNGFSGLRYDYGKFYASKSFYDETKNRRVLWGWVNESSRVEDDVKKGWAGIMVNVQKIFFASLGVIMVIWSDEFWFIIRQFQEGYGWIHQENNFTSNRLKRPKNSGSNRFVCLSKCYTDRHWFESLM